MDSVQHPAVDVLEFVQPPQAFSVANSGQPAIDQEWWSVFGDEALNGFIVEALENSPQLAIAETRVALAQSQRAFQAGLKHPTLGAGLDLSRRRQNFIGLPIPGSSVVSSLSDSHGLALQGQWELDLWGRLAAGERAAVFDVSVGEANLRAAQLALSGAIVHAYVGMCEAQANVELLKAALTNAQERQNQVSLNERIGRQGDVQAVLAAQAEVQRAATALLEAKRVLTTQAPNFTALLGRTAGQSIHFEPELLVRSLPPLPSTGVPAELLERRPDLASLLAGVHAANARAEVAHASLWPELSLSSSVGTVSDGLRDLLDGDFGVWTLGASLIAPLLDGGRLQAGLDGALAVRDGAVWAFVQGALVAFAEVETALINEELLAQRQLQMRNLLETLEQQWVIAEQRHRLGRSPASSIFDVRAQIFNSQREALHINRLLYSNRVSLYMALGGGFDSKELSAK